MFDSVDISKNYSGSSAYFRVETHNRFQLVIITLSLFSILLSPQAFADRDPNRDVLCATRQINVSKAQFEKCFEPVRPAKSHAPNGKRQRDNKALLLPCLQKANPQLANRALDKAMDACRPEGPIKN